MVAVYQLFDDVDFSSSIIGKTIIKSDIDQKVAINLFSYNLDIELYVNSIKVEFEDKTQNVWQQNNWVELNLKKGNNNILIVGKSTGFFASTFKFLIFDDKYSHIYLKVLDENGKYLDNPNIFIKNDSHFESFRPVFGSNYIYQKVDGDYPHKFWLLPGDYFIGANTNDKFDLSKKIKVSNRSNQKITLSLVKPANYIKGSVLTLDKETAHPGLVIQVENTSDMSIFDKKITKMNGEFSFIVPQGEYYLRMFANDRILYHKTDGKKTRIKVNADYNHEQDYKFFTQNQIKGSWDEISMFDGMLSNGAHVSLVSNDDLLYLGTYNGLSIYDGQKVESFNYEHGLPNGYIGELFEDNDGFLWIGYGGKGLIKWKDGNVLQHYTKENGLPSDRINAIDQNKDGELLIGTARGLSIFDGNSFENYERLGKRILRK